MGHHHDHSHHHHHHHHHHETENIAFAFFLNLIFTIIEIIGGFYTNSVAILSDALHDLGDSLSLGLAWYFQKLSKKGRDKTYSYGYKRFSLLGAIINSIVLVIGSIFILMEAIPRLVNPESPNAKGMMVLAILGILVNGAAVLKLKKGESLNEKVVSLHLMEDVLGWVAVLIGSILIYFFDIPILDPILSILIATYILFNVFKNLKYALKIVLQAIPTNTDTEAIKKQLTALSDLKNIHDVHIWTLDGQYNVMTLHAVLKNSKSLEEQALLKKEIRTELAKLNVHHATIEFELEGEECELLDC